MVVKMMKWRPWPPNYTKKFQVRVTLHSLEGIPPTADKVGEAERVMIDVKWKGPKGALGSRFRRTLKRERTTDKLLAENGIITWDEGFEHECVLSLGRKSNFQPWNVHFIVLQTVQQGSKTTLSVLGTAIMNIADFAPPKESSSQILRICVSRSNGGGSELEAALAVTVDFIELRTFHEALDPVPWIMSPSLPCIGGPLPQEKDEQCQECTDKEEMKNFKCNGAGIYGKKVSGELDMSDDGKLSPKSAESSQDSGELFDSDSMEDYDFEDIGCTEDYNLRKSFSYGTLAGVNLFVEGVLPHYKDYQEDNDTAGKCISIHSRTGAEAIPKLTDDAATSDSDQASSQPTMRSFLSWKRRKLSFRSPRARGEPLLNKAYGEDGGDDIDFDRRQSGSPIEPIAIQPKGDGCSPTTVSGYLDFGDEHFSIGSWEKKILVSRDGQMRLSANAFFASIDQRSERAAGQSACTALVAVIADWLHRNPNRMPIRAEFDTLIREGSAEWRKLCEIEAYKDRFPDQHFDLDTVLQAELRPLLVVPERSFIGFFQPEGLGDTCDFLEGAMSFENIWDAIWEESVSMKPEDFEPAIYIVSWNDHFFVLKVEREAYYIIDTLGERLFEGCNQAYILRFDKEASLCHVPKVQKANGENRTFSGPLPATAISLSDTTSQAVLSNQVDEGLHSQEGKEEQNGGKGGVNSQKVEKVANIVYEGKEACKQFVKGFFAALPLRELQTDKKKGLLGKVPLHRRLQIEFHYTLLGIK